MVRSSPPDRPVDVMQSGGPANWLREARRAIARLPSLRLGKLPESPALPVRDPWPGDPGEGARLLRGELAFGGAVAPLRPGGWPDATAPLRLRAAAHGFAWLRDLRALGTDAARLRARALIADWIGAAQLDAVAISPDVTGARLAAWLGHYDFFAASADDLFRQRLMARLIGDARDLAAALPAEAQDVRALVALKGLIAAAVALPEQAAFLTRALRFLPAEIGQQILPDGCHVCRSPAAQLAALQELMEIRALLHAAQVGAPPALASALERMAPAMRALRHGDGGLALFNGTGEANPALIDLALAQAPRNGRAPQSLAQGGFERLQAGRSVVVVDCGVPPAPGRDGEAHAGTLSFEFSVGRERLVVNCGATASGASPAWRDAIRATAAHSTLVIADVSSSELRPEGLGRRPQKIELQRQEANGAYWLEASHDGWRQPFGAIHRRRLYLSESGEDVRGEDLVESANPLAFTVRFHLHPSVSASPQQDGEAILLRLPGGSLWRLRADGAAMSVEESIYLGGGEPRRSEQLVLAGRADGPQQVKWAITKLG